MPVAQEPKQSSDTGDQDAVGVGRRLSRSCRRGPTASHWVWSPIDCWLSSPTHEAPELPGIRSPVGDVGGKNKVLDADQEAVVARLREALAGIASTLGSDAEARSVQATEIALDGAEFAIRGELASGNAGRVMNLLPSFVFLVALSIADRDTALGLSRRTAQLIEQFER